MRERDIRVIARVFSAGKGVSLEFNTIQNIALELSEGRSPIA